jgi:hypothetical protein
LQQQRLAARLFVLVTLGHLVPLAQRFTRRLPVRVLRPDRFSLGDFRAVALALGETLGQPRPGTVTAGAGGAQLAL